MDKDIRIYVAGPIKLGHRMDNIRAALDAAEEIMRVGAIPFIPHLNSFWHVVHPHPVADWMRWDFAWLRTCQALFRLPGESVGSDDEYAEMVRLGRPVFTDMAALQRWIRGCFSRQRVPLAMQAFPAPFEPTFDPPVNSVEVLRQAVFYGDPF